MEATVLISADKTTNKNAKDEFRSENKIRITAKSKKYNLQDTAKTGKGIKE